MSAGTMGKHDTDEEAGRGKTQRRAGGSAHIRAHGQGKGLDLTGPDGLLRQFTRSVPETALDEEMTEHLGRGQAQEIQGRQGREHAQRHHRQDRGHRFGRPGQDRGAARPRWRTVFVSPTLLMLPGVIVMMALPARVRANPTSGTRPSSAGSSWSHTCTSNARTMRSPPCRSSCSPPRRRGASADSSRADASTRPEMDQNPE